MGWLYSLVEGPLIVWRNLDSLLELYSLLYFIFSRMFDENIVFFFSSQSVDTYCQMTFFSDFS